MRGHPLTGRPARLLSAILLVPLLVGSVAAGPAVTATPLAPVGVTITTAPDETLAFRPAETTVRAAAVIQLTFRNASSVSHNLVFTGGLIVASRTIVEPGTFDRLLIVQTTPGAYVFVCTIHAGMTGTLIIGDVS